eukprot:TRINITY_DN1046_c0_g2_i1.p1 TRINITY_DN1046_c0_g2~~TRINITY_DN1046_c0_g2_i1.p1  ORF type:complete len:300 (-),score=74.94 TRINITY_DN1046_c0_g2_i1:17-916(-)
MCIRDRYMGKKKKEESSDTSDQEEQEDEEEGEAEAEEEEESEEEDEGKEKKEEKVQKERRKRFPKRKEETSAEKEGPPKRFTRQANRTKTKVLSDDDKKNESLLARPKNVPQGFHVGSEFSRERRGAFHFGDIADTIVYEKNFRDDRDQLILVFTVKWTTRSDGFRPLPREYTNFQLQEFAPKLLASYYEQRLNLRHQPFRNPESIENSTKKEGEKPSDGSLVKYVKDNRSTFPIRSGSNKNVPISGQQDKSLPKNENYDLLAMPSRQGASTSRDQSRPETEKSDFINYDIGDFGNTSD